MKWLLILLSFSAYADENILPATELQAQGYKVWKYSNKSVQSTPAHSLNWPVRFQDAAHQMGNTMAQFQPFGGAPYFHGGCDLRVSAGAEVIAPVRGKIEAGHYGYSTNTDGSLTKHWIAWPGQGSPIYFEVAVVADDGIRYEFHHMERDSLPDNIVKMLDAGGGTVEAGALLGYVIEWPGGDYHHTHYNIILPNGVRVNPEFVSLPLQDTLAPEISAAFAVMPNGSVVDFSRGVFSQKPQEIIVAVKDKKNFNVYEHPPVYASFKFDAGGASLWDFRQFLLVDGKFPNLFEFYKESLTLPNGRRIRTEGGYGMGQSLIRVKVPAGVGAFTIEIGDVVGNISTLRGTIQ